MVIAPILSLTRPQPSVPAPPAESAARRLAGASIGLARSLLASSAGAVMIVTTDGKILASSQGADSLLQTGDTLRSANGYLRCARAGESAELLAALRLAGQSPRAERVLRLAGTAGRALPVVLRGLEAPGLVAAFAPVAAAAAAPDWTIVSQCYKLTPAECRLALLLAQAKALCRVAGELGVSVSTVKSQARAIYLKTGVVRQTELIGLLTQLPAAAVQAQTLRPWSDPSARSDAVRQTLSPPRSRRGLGTERTARAAGQPSARV